MPVNQGNNNFNLGRDITIVLLTSSGTVISVPNLLDWNPKPVYADVKVDKLNGVQMNASLPKGWTCTLTNARGDSGLDLFVAAIEQAWYANGTYVGGSAYEYITETNGAQTVWQYTNGAYKLTDAGSWKGDDSVKQTLEVMFDRRIQRQ
jgi:hypothetical protein